MHENHYPSDLTEAVWELIKDVISPPNRMGPPRLEMRAVVNALLYVVDRVSHGGYSPMRIRSAQGVRVFPAITR